MRNNNSISKQKLLSKFEEIKKDLKAISEKFHNQEIVFRKYLNIGFNSVLAKSISKIDKQLNGYNEKLDKIKNSYEILKTQNDLIKQLTDIQINEIQNSIEKNEKSKFFIIGQILFYSLFNYYSAYKINPTEEKEKFIIKFINDSVIRILFRNSPVLKLPLNQMCCLTQILITNRHLITEVNYNEYIEKTKIMFDNKNIFKNKIFEKYYEETNIKYTNSFINIINEGFSNNSEKKAPHKKNSKKKFDKKSKVNDKKEKFLKTIDELNDNCISSYKILFSDLDDTTTLLFLNPIIEFQFLLPINELFTNINSLLAVKQVPTKEDLEKLDNYFELLNKFITEAKIMFEKFNLIKWDKVEDYQYVLNGLLNGLHNTIIFCNKKITLIEAIKKQISLTLYLNKYFSVGSEEIEKNPFAEHLAKAAYEKESSHLNNIRYYLIWQQEILKLIKELKNLPFDLFNITSFYNSFYNPNIKCLSSSEISAENKDNLKNNNIAIENKETEYKKLLEENKEEQNKTEPNKLEFNTREDLELNPGQMGLPIKNIERIVEQPVKKLSKKARRKAKKMSKDVNPNELTSNEIQKHDNKDFLTEAKKVVYIPELIDVPIILANIENVEELIEENVNEQKLISEISPISIEITPEVQLENIKTVNEVGSQGSILSNTNIVVTEKLVEDLCKEPAQEILTFNNVTISNNIDPEKVSNKNEEVNLRISHDSKENLNNNIIKKTNVIPRKEIIYKEREIYKGNPTFRRQNRLHQESQNIKAVSNKQSQITFEAPIKNIESEPLLKQVTILKRHNYINNKYISFDIKTKEKVNNKEKSNKTEINPLFSHASSSNLKETDSKEYISSKRKLASQQEIIKNTGLDKTEKTKRKINYYPNNNDKTLIWVEKEKQDKKGSENGIKKISKIIEQVKIISIEDTNNVSHTCNPVTTFKDPANNHSDSKIVKKVNNHFVRKIRYKNLRNQLFLRDDLGDFGGAIDICIEAQKKAIKDGNFFEKAEFLNYEGNYRSYIALMYFRNCKIDSYGIFEYTSFFPLPLIIDQYIKSAQVFNEALIQAYDLRDKEDINQNLLLELLMNIVGQVGEKGGLYDQVENLKNKIITTHNFYKEIERTFKENYIAKFGNFKPHSWTITPESIALNQFNTFLTQSNTLHIDIQKVKDLYNSWLNEVIPRPIVSHISYKTLDGRYYYLIEEKNERTI